MKAMTILNRIVEWTNVGIQYEADPRHVDLIIEELGLENANRSDVTGSKVDVNETDTELDHEDAYRFRSIAARLNFLAADRIDIQFASKEISGPRFESWGDICGSTPDRYCGLHGRMSSPTSRYTSTPTTLGAPAHGGPPMEVGSCTEATC